MESKLVKRNGSQYWCVGDKLHREDGPAAEHVDGSKIWCINGKLHREDGPAVEDCSGIKLWYLNGKYIADKEPKNWKELVTESSLS